MMKRKYLYLIAAIIWGIPGIIITVKGVKAYHQQSPDDIWWLLMITVAVLAFFFLMFRRIVNRYSDRIATLPDTVKPWHTFPVRGWILMLFMMGLGMTLKYVPGVPLAFIASFYSGLGPMLLMSSVRFILNSF